MIYGLVRGLNMSKLEPTIEERLVRAFLDVLILQTISRKPMTGYELDNYILKKLKLDIGPNVIYTKLSSLERQNLITCTSYGRGRIYMLTKSGASMVGELGHIVEEIQRSAIIFDKHQFIEKLIV
jgi:DNA-binding PadR family transcriptional regulator